MRLTPAYDDGTVSVYLCEHAALAEHLRETGVRPDAMIVDCPYSAVTHEGHDAISEKAVALGRRPLNYEPWTGADVRVFVAEWSPLVRGWIASLTDDLLAQDWRRELAGAGRCTFAPLPLVQFGSRVRLSGDGPSSITTQIVVARPRNAEFMAWGTLPGAYVQAPGWAERPVWAGGKTPWACRALVRDYSRSGDLIVDPCCGAGTLGVAVRYEGRRAILADKDPAAVECTIKRLRGERTKPTNADLPGDADHALALFRGER
jgi:hypothetical protein